MTASPQPCRFTFDQAAYHLADRGKPPGERAFQDMSQLVSAHLGTRLSVAAHPDFIVKIPNRRGLDALATGTKVKIGWSQSDCRALDDK